MALQDGLRLILLAMIREAKDESQPDDYRAAAGFVAGFIQDIIPSLDSLSDKDAAAITAMSDQFLAEIRPEQ